MKKLKQLLVRGHSPPIQILIFKLIYNILNHKTMKTLKLNLLFTLFLTLISNAQITKGNWMMGGQFGFSYSNNKVINNSEINNSGFQYVNIDNIDNYEIIFEPKIGYFIKDKFVLGIKIGYENNFSNQHPLSIKNSQFSFSPYFRYYFLNKESNFNLFVEPSYYRYTYKPLGNNEGYGLSVGYVYFLNSSVGIESTINYQNRKNNQLEENRLSLGLGFQIHLEKK